MILQFHVFILDSGYLSLGCSHTVAFMRAIHHGCKDPNGELPHIPKSDPIWEAIEEGWWWHVISSQVEDAIPKLPQFIQMALNASNSIHKAINELEVACQAATIFEQTKSLQEALSIISQGDLQCRTSLPAIGHYVSRFGGGDGMPLIKFLASFGTIFNATLLLGQEFMGALAHHNFNHPTCLFPMLRTAIWATMLTTSKSMEGYARLLSKGDLPKIGTPLTRAMQAETILLDAWKIIQASIGSPTTWTGQDAKTEDKAKHGYKCFGKLCIRMIHFMAKKKNTHEAKEFKSMEEITLQFSQDIQGQQQTESQKTQQQSSSSRQQVQNVIAASPSTIALLQNNHMELHGMFFGHAENEGFPFFNISIDINEIKVYLPCMFPNRYCLPKEHGSQVFQLTAIDDSAATMTQSPFWHQISSSKCHWTN